MRIDPSKNYSMPLVTGPINEREQGKLDYTQVEVLIYQFLTDPEALEVLLPGCYLPGKQPLVTVMYAENHGLASLAGGGYRSLSIQVSAIFAGEHDHVEGDYILVAFENQSLHLLLGREKLGVPNLHAAISPLKLIPDGHLRCEASLWGHMLVGLDVFPLKRQSLIMKAMTSRQLNARPCLAYKYIPSIEGPPDASYPTIIVNETRLDKLFHGKKANLRFGTARYEDIGRYKTLIDTLATLTILRPVQVLHFTGTSAIKHDLSRRLK